MSLRWEISNKVQAFKGWARQRFGRVTGNRRQQATGKSDRVVGNLKQAGDKARDAFKR
ncbi:CsbD family protein [Nonomuraea spiralis]|uniref:CsbD family protein n=1 Tax=Nonomuraea TaxID=83681 RepID=UPI000F783479|nr:CsbD family protein [Nonomuraea sp. WAC 01424]RSN15680.1 CsbD family protein [Nonomuraea sp. WAC 01424]